MTCDFVSNNQLLCDVVKTRQTGCNLFASSTCEHQSKENQPRCVDGVQMNEKNRLIVWSCLHCPTIFEILAKCNAYSTMA